MLPPLTLKSSRSVGCAGTVTVCNPDKLITPLSEAVIEFARMVLLLSFQSALMFCNDETSSNEPGLVADKINPVNVPGDKVHTGPFAFILDPPLTQS